MSLVSLGSALVKNLSLVFAAGALMAGSAEPVQVPGGIIDDAGKVLYLTGVKSGVVAVDAERGDVLWERTDASKPLVLVDDRLAVLATEQGEPNVLRVRFLDVMKDKGARVHESDPLTFPAWVDVGNGRDHDGEGRRFSLRADRTGDELRIHWAAGTSYYGGANPPLDLLESSRRSASGVAQVDLRSGKVEMLADGGEPPAKDRRTPVEQLPEHVRELARRERWQFAHVVGARAYGQVNESKSGGEVIHLIRAVDLGTGEPLWKRSFGQTLYLPPPP